MQALGSPTASATTEVSLPVPAARPTAPPGKPSLVSRVLNSVLPILFYFRTFKLSNLQMDIVAGLTIAVIVLPQGLAYAKLADLPPVFGLYGCILPPLVYAVFGTSCQTHIGPFALVSMVVRSVLTTAIVPLPDESPEAYSARYNAASLDLGLLGSFFFIGFYILRLGVLTVLLSDAVLNGFTVASAFNISASQLKGFFGVNTISGSALFILIDFFKNIKGVNWVATVVGIACLLLLIVMRMVNQRVKWFKVIPLPAEMICVIIFTLISYYAHLSARLSVVGVIPKGLPPFAWPSLSAANALLPGTILVVFISFVVTLSIGKTFEYQNEKKVDSNQELLALGIASLLGSISSCYSPAGSLSRSAVVSGIAVRTPFHNVISTVIIIIVLLFLTSALEALPSSVLSAIVISAFISIFLRLQTLPSLFRKNRLDFFLWIISFLMTVILDTQIGILSGLGASFVVMLLTALWGYSASKKSPLLDGEERPSLLKYAWNHIGNSSDVEEHKSFVRFRPHSCLLYVNSLFVRESMQGHILELSSKVNDAMKLFVLDLSDCPFVDDTGCNQLSELSKFCQKLGVHLLFLHPSPRVAGALHRYGLDHRGECMIVVQSEDEVEAYYDKFLQEYGIRLSERQSAIREKSDVTALRTLAPSPGPLVKEGVSAPYRPDSGSVVLLPDEDELGLE